MVRVFVAFVFIVVHTYCILNLLGFDCSFHVMSCFNVDGANFDNSSMKVPPLKLIQRIIAISPQSICQTSNDQGTVLHRLLRCQIIPGRPTTAKSKESIARILIDANPNCLRIADSNGWLPLHVLCAHARNPEFLLQPDFLRLIIQPFAESISTENKGGVTPISMLLSNSIYGLDGDCQISTHMIEAQYYNSASTCNYAVMNKYVNELRQWQCVILMLQAADGNIKAVPTPSDLPLHLFAASSLASCQLLAIASVIHKRDILIQDGKGNLPLHLACHKRHSREEIEYPFSKVGILVKLCPEASKMKNTKGYLPLFLAVENYACDWENGMEHLVQSYPDSLAEKYPDHQIYPFMMLASKYNKQEEHQHQQNSLLSCLYHFIRAYPDLICHY